MPAVFVVSDTHFGHTGVCRFTHQDTGIKIRPWDNPDEMDEYMVKAWNNTVRPNDKVLIRGNHDIFKMDDYTKYFRDIRGYHVMNNMILSHIPVHPDSKGRFAANIHGHLHSNRVRKPRGVDAKTGEILYSNDIDPWYYNVSVEQTFFKPILFEHVLEKIKKQGQAEYTYEGFGKFEFE